MKTMSFDFKSRRSMVSARRGMVGASNPLAAQAGLNILRQGGNAADAAIATSAVMNVTEPGACGIGGDCFALFYDAQDESSHRLERQRARAGSLDFGNGPRAGLGADESLPRACGYRAGGGTRLA